MKKLVIAAAIVCAAVAANASNVQWGLQAGQTLDSTKVDKGTMYLVYTTGSMDWTKLSGLESFSKATLYTVGATDVWDSFDYSSSKVNNAVTIVPTSTGPDSKAAIGGGQKSFYYVCIDDGAKDIAYTANATISMIAPSAMGTGSYVAASAFSYAVAKDPEPTPEPTSGLLMLLGVAGLALRRKQK